MCRQHKSSCRGAGPFVERPIKLMTAMLDQIIPQTGAGAVIPGNHSRKIPILPGPGIYEMRNCRG